MAGNAGKTGERREMTLPLPRYSPAVEKNSYQPWTKTHLSVRRGSPYGAYGEMLSTNSLGGYELHLCCTVLLSLLFQKSLSRSLWPKRETGQSNTATESLGTKQTLLRSRTIGEPDTRERVDLVTITVRKQNNPCNMFFFFYQTMSERSRGCGFW